MILNLSDSSLVLQIMRAANITNKIAIFVKLSNVPKVDSLTG